MWHTHLLKQNIFFCDEKRNRATFETNVPSDEKGGYNPKLFFVVKSHSHSIF